MKKLLLALSLLTLLAGCEEPVVNSTPGDPEDEKMFAPTPFYILDLDINETHVNGGDYILTVDPVEWLSESEGTCRNSAEVTDEASSIPQCNPNGFLIVNDDTENKVQYYILEQTSVYVNNVIFSSHPETKTLDGVETITFEELMISLEDSPDFFAVTPFEVEYGTITVDGVEMSDQVTSIKEIYIP